MALFNFLVFDFFVEKIEEGSEKNKGVLVGDSKNYTNLKGDAKNMEHLIENYMNQSGAKFGLMISRDNGFLRSEVGDEYAWNFVKLDPLDYPDQLDILDEDVKKISELIFQACDRNISKKSSVA